LPPDMIFTVDFSGTFTGDVGWLFRSNSGALHAPLHTHVNCVSV
jgi:hypothetical protein